MQMPTPCNRCGRTFDLQKGNPCHKCHVTFCRRCARDTPAGWRCKTCRPAKAKTRAVALLALAALPVTTALAGPATQPAEWIVVGSKDGGQRVYGRHPKPGESPISDELDAVASAAWRPVPATQPATGPVVVVTPPPPADPNLVTVTPGTGWAAAVRAAKPGQTVYLAPGVHTGPGLTDPALRLSGVTIRGAGIGKTTIRVTDGTALALWGATGCTVQGVTFAAVTPTAQGVRLLSGCKDVGLADCEVTGFTFGVTSEGMATRNQGVTLARCYVHDNYHPTNQRSSGLYADLTDNLTLLDSTFDRNGWSPDVPAAKGTTENHDAYIAGSCGPATVHHNVFARASSHGLQARSGGDVTDNDFLDNPIHVSFGKVNGGGPIFLGGVTGRVYGNRFVGTRLLAGQPRGYAIETGNVRDVAITDNVFAYDGGAYDPKSGQFAAAVKVDVCKLDPTNPMLGKAVGVGKLAVSGNRGDWAMGAIWANPELGPWDSTRCERAFAGGVDVAATRREVEARLAAASK